MKKNNQNLRDILYLAQMAAMEAGDHALRQFTKVHVLKEKQMSTDEFTSVDIENERIIYKILKKSFPKYTILTEERKIPKRKSRRFWWVDPLDGSISYFFGLPYWGVTLALIEKDEPIIGVIYFPQTHTLYWAVKNQGAFCNYKKISVSGSRYLKDGVICLDYGYRTEREEGIKDVTMKLIDKVKYAVSYACMAASMALVAEGKLIAHIHHMARRFDHAAGALLVMEAGGTITDIQGKPIDWRDTKPVHIISSNKKTHKQLIRILK